MTMLLQPTGNDLQAAPALAAGRALAGTAAAA